MRHAATVDGLARVDLGIWPTPLVQAPRLGSTLDTAGLWLKRDDLSGFSWGGNKVRTVEFLLGDALANGATEIVMAGGPSSNFAALMAAGARSVGLAVHQISYGCEPEREVAALREGRSHGATVVFTASADRSLMDDFASRYAAERAEAGAIPYVVPRGGATAVGALGFLAAAIEIDAQADRDDDVPSTIVIPLGSGGSVAGLVAGLGASRRRWNVHAVSVSREPESIYESIVNRAVRAGELSGLAIDPRRVSETLEIHDGRAPGFGLVSDGQVDLMREITGTTGLLVDPTYNAKALDWMRHANQTETLRGRPAIYWHTGGALGALDHIRSLERTPIS